jgi:hypothetical protein
MCRTRLVIWVLSVVVALSGTAPALAQGREPRVALPNAPLAPATAPKILPGSGGIAIETVGQLGGAVTAVDVQGNRAYLGVGPRLVILDVSDPANPTMLGQSALFNGPTAHVSQVLAVGTQAYVVADECLYQVDVTNPAAPAIVGPVPYPPDPEPIPHPRPRPDQTYSMRIAMEGTRLYVAFSRGDGYIYVSHHCFVALYATSEAGPPEFVATITDQSFTQRGFSYYYADLIAEEGLLWVSDGYDPWDSAGDIASYQIDSALGVRTGNRIPSGYGPSLVRSGNYLCAVERPSYRDTSRLRTIDISKPLSPTLAATCPISDCVDAALAPGGDLIYAAGEDGLDILDVSDPLNPRKSGRLQMNATALCVTGSYAYVASGDMLAILDVTVPDQPMQVGQWYSAGSVERMAVSGDHVYLSDGSSTLRIADISDPAWPTVVGSYTTAAPVVDLAAEGRYVYLTTSDAVMVLDVTDPTQPMLAHVAQGFAEGAVRQVRVLGEWLYVLSEGPDLTMFLLYDLASPDWQPEGQLRIPLLENLEQVSRDYAYVWRQYEEEWTSYVEIVPIPLHSGNTPDALVFIDAEKAVVNTDASGGAVLISTSSTYCAPSTVTSIYDMSNVSSPCLVSTTNWEIPLRCGDPLSLYAESTFLSGGFGLLYGWSHYSWCNGSDTARELAIVDLRQPNATRVVAELPLDTPVEAQVVGDLLFETHGRAGFLIRRLVWPTFVWQAEAEDPSFWAYGDAGQDEHASSCGFIAGAVEVPVSVPATGDYFMWVRGIGMGGVESPVEIVTNYACLHTPLPVAPADEGGWSWQRSVRPIRVGAGVDYVVIQPLSQTVSIDCFILTDDPYFVPSAITPCGGILALPLVMK